MRQLLLGLAFVALARGAEINIAAMGPDLNGWSGGVGRYSLSGASFEVTRPATRTDANGNLIVITLIRERKRRSPVFEGTLTALISPDGLVRTLEMEGTVEGKPFETGKITRPEPIVPSAAGEGETAGGVFDVTPVNPQKGMRDSLSQSLRSAIERARASEKVVKRDLGSRLFPSEASSADAIAEGTDVVVRSIFLRGGR